MGRHETGGGLKQSWGAVSFPLARAWNRY